MEITKLLSYVSIPLSAYCLWTFKRIMSIQLKMAEHDGAEKETREQYKDIKIGLEDLKKEVHKLALQLAKTNPD